MTLNPFRKRKKAKPELAKLLKEHFKITPRDVVLYEQALRHSSANKTDKWDNNERLEFLGDSVLDTVVADLLFERHPKHKEGELTKMRSAVVSRERLDRFGKQIGLMMLVEKDKKQDLNNSAVCGNALEALIGAIYMDQGFDNAKKAIDHFLALHMESDEFDRNIKDPKSRLLEWGQKNDKSVEFKVEDSDKPDRTFLARIMIGGQEVSQGIGSSKKRAEQSAAAKALEDLIDD